MATKSRKFEQAEWFKIFSAKKMRIIAFVLASVITAFFFALSIYPVSDGTSRAAKTARITSTTISSTNVNPRLRLFLSM